MMDRSDLRRSVSASFVVVELELELELELGELRRKLRL